MRTVYACQFELTHEESEPEQILHDAQALACRWVVGWYERKGIPIEPPDSWADQYSPADGHEVTLDTEAADSTEISSLTWHYPDHNDSNTLWHSEVKFGRSGREVEASIIIRLDSQEAVVAPFRYNLGRPGIVSDVAESFAVVRRGRQVPVTEVQLGVSDIEGFLVDDLLDPNRCIPIILLSPMADGQQFPTDPSELADRMVGLGEVFVMRDREATFQLTDVVGKDLSCFNGAIRIYWPGFEADCDPYDHPLYLPSRLADLPDICKHLLHEIVDVAVLRHVPGRVIREAEAAKERRREERLSRLQERARQATDKSQELKEVWEYAQEMTKAHDLAARRVARLEDANAALQDKVSQLEIAVQHMPRSTAASVADLERETQPEAPTSVADALKRIEHEYPDVIVVHSRAHASASASCYGNPQRAYNALQFIADVYRRKFAGPLGKNIDQVFNDANYNVRWGIGIVTKGRYASQYHVEYGGRTVCLEPHITFKGKANENCLSIHWYEDKEDHKVLIGYCGEHLDTDTG